MWFMSKAFDTIIDIPFFQFVTKAAEKKTKKWYFSLLHTFPRTPIETHTSRHAHSE